MQPSVCCHCPVVAEVVAGDIHDKSECNITTETVAETGNTLFWNYLTCRMGKKNSNKFNALFFLSVWIVQVVNRCIWLFSLNRWDKSVHWRERGRGAGWRLLSFWTPVRSGSDWGLFTSHGSTSHGCHKPAVQPQRLYG